MKQNGTRVEYSCVVFVWSPFADTAAAAAGRRPSVISGNFGFSTSWWRSFRQQSTREQQYQHAACPPKREPYERPHGRANHPHPRESPLRPPDMDAAEGTSSARLRNDTEACFLCRGAGIFTSLSGFRRAWQRASLHHDYFEALCV